MDMLEKVEKLRQKADVSYEEAKAALTATNGDLLDAMILLEQEGKTKAPEQERYSTEYNNEDMLYPVPCAKRNKENRKRDCNGKSFWDKLKELWVKSCENYLVIDKDDSTIIRMPIWVFVLVILVGWHTLWLVMIISLFFGCRYRFEGPDDLETANKASEKVSEAAQTVKDSFNKKDTEETVDQ